MSGAYLAHATVIPLCHPYQPGDIPMALGPLHLGPWCLPNPQNRPSRLASPDSFISALGPGVTATLWVVPAWAPSLGPSRLAVSMQPSYHWSMTPPSSACAPSLPQGAGHSAPQVAWFLRDNLRAGGSEQGARLLATLKPG